MQPLRSYLIHKLHSHSDGGEYFSTTREAADENLRFMLSLARDVDVRDGKGMAPLHLAVCGNHPSSVSILLEHGADINATQAQGRTPLDLAIIFRRSEIHQLLEASGGRANATNTSPPAAGEALKT